MPLGLGYLPRQSECIECLRPFVKTHPSQTTCGDECREKRRAHVALGAERKRQQRRRLRPPPVQLEVKKGGNTRV